ncbi:ALX homeobox protein 1 [Phodopus roborovskii]|uniref:Rhox12 protein n=1 Tax=Phodopus roborovskii TaxID=109678 RepID=A0AAU9YYP6_PHORO|nr:ALX homeobox protein 1 [Phodopus roborovskii]XP_051034420.1 ALX homeobox protein 1 [Phodopus roborovskii]CAH6779918.1 Rhox12 [Phodopus roborovskii]
MAFHSKHVDPNFYKLGENEIEVSLDFEEEDTTTAENGTFGKVSLNGSDKSKNHGLPDHKDDVIHSAVFNSLADNNKNESPQGSGHPQMEGQEKMAASRVPRVRRRRPRIQFGLTPRQLSELEDVFEKTKYPDEIIRKDLAKRLFLGESRVRSWFKRRRAKYRKTQQSLMLQCESADRSSEASSCPSTR